MTPDWPLRALIAALLAAVAALPLARLLSRLPAHMAAEFRVAGEALSPLEEAAAAAFATDRSRRALAACLVPLAAAAAAAAPDLASGLVTALGAGLLAALIAIDWQVRRLPAALTGALLWSGLLAAAAGLTPVAPAAAIAAAACGWVMFRLVDIAAERIAGRVMLGGGDAAFAAACGAWLGPLALWVAVLLGSLLLIGWAAWRRGREDPYVPYAPGLGGVTLLALLWPEGWGRIMGWAARLAL